MTLLTLSSVFLFFTSLFNIGIDVVNDIDNPTGFSNLFVPDLTRNFDFIVGGGATGSVIASRLSENPDVTVLLIEAGSDGSWITNVPIGIFLSVNTKYDWKYLSQPQSFNCLGFVQGKCKLNRGKVLGGSTVLNALAYVRGNRKDFDLWESMGNKGWSYEDVLPYFKKIETMNVAELRKDERYHGISGPLPISYPNYITPLSKAWVKAGKELGYEEVDYNAENQTGFSLAQTTTRFGKRISAAKAYLKPAKKRRNLSVLLNSVVTKVIRWSVFMLDREMYFQILIHEGEAYGVEFLRHGFLKWAYASKEVILSAGAFGSPQILMISGIGPAHELRKHNITVLKELPVGKNMESHVSVGGLSFSLDKPESLLLFPVLFNSTNYLTFLGKQGKGPFGAVPIDALSFVNTPLNNDSSWPDIQMEFESFNIITNDGGSSFQHSTNIRWDVLEAFRPLFYRHSVHIPLYVNRPRSRGEVLLQSSNPLDKPIIITNWYKDPFDSKVAVEGIKILLKIMETNAFRKYGAKFFQARLPGCTHFPSKSDEYWDCYVRHFSWTNFHETGTCRMGSSADKNTVTDPKLRVHGIGKLRVADASIFPKITSGNIQAVCYMIGEKVADMIKQAWNL